MTGFRNIAIGTAVPFALSAPAAMASVSERGELTAAETNCDTWLTKKVRSGLPDVWIGNVKCSSISYNTKVRGRLHISYDLDCYSAWFTRVNVAYQTCGAVFVDGVSYATAPL